jgi:hypothetical protein
MFTRLGVSNGRMMFVLGQRSIAVYGATVNTETETGPCEGGSQAFFHKRA